VAGVLKHLATDDPAGVVYTDEGRGPLVLVDTEAINRLGNRLDAYSSISLPVLLLTGAKTPAHLRERTDRLAAVLPAARPVADMPKQGHGASERAPGVVAGLIRDFVRSL
jgi:pimeloyl-ACP methyl ester carboxylesterase